MPVMIVFSRIICNIRTHRCCLSQRTWEYVLITNCKTMSSDKDSSDFEQKTSAELTDSPNAHRGKQKARDKRLRIRDLQIKSLSFLATVDETALNPQQQAIHTAHVEALKAGKLFYTDPATGYKVMSRLAHLNRGDCCGNACRHCPFGQINAPEELKRTNNSAFYE